MGSGRSGGAELPDFGPDNKAHLPQQFNFPKHEFRKSGRLFRLSHKDRPRPWPDWFKIASYGPDLVITASREGRSTVGLIFY